MNQNYCHCHPMYNALSLVLRVIAKRILENFYSSFPVKFTENSLVEVYFSLYVCFCVFCGLQLDAKNEKANELFSALAYRWDQYADVSQIIKLITSFSRTKIQFRFYSHKIGGSPWSNCSRWYLSERLLRGKFVARRGVVFEGKLSCSCRERFAL